MFSTQEGARRRTALAALIREQGLQGVYLIGNRTTSHRSFGSFRYFTDDAVFYFLESVLALPDGELLSVVEHEMGRLGLVETTFITDAVIDADQLGGIWKILRARNITRGKLGVVKEVMPATWLLRFEKEMPELELVDVSEELYTLRRVRSQEEIESQQQGAKIAREGWDAVRSALKGGMSETEAVSLAEYAMQRLGAEESFLLITSGPVSQGKMQRPALHNTACMTRTMEKGDVVTLEIAPRYNGCWARLTRTACLEWEDPALSEKKAMAEEAMLAASRELRAGAPIGRVAETMLAATRKRGLTLDPLCGWIMGTDLCEEPITETNSTLLTEGMTVLLRAEERLSTAAWGDSWQVTPDGGVRLSGDSFGNL